MQAKFSLPNDAEGKDQAKWYMLHGCRSIEDGKFIRVVIPITCAWLAFNGQKKEYFCANYENRPEICKNYNCKKGGDDNGQKAEIRI
jgi:hypothetical protein